MRNNGKTSWLPTGRSPYGRNLINSRWETRVRRSGLFLLYSVPQKKPYHMVIMKIPNITAAGGDALTSFEGNVTQTATAGGSGAGAGVGKAIVDPVKIVKP